MIAEKKPRIGPKVPATGEGTIGEIVDGKPLYYKGYRDALSGKRTSAEIAGINRLKSFVLTGLFRELINALRDDQYILFINLGLHLDRGSNLSGDIVIYETATMPPEAIDEYYSDIPANSASKSIVR